MKQPNIRFKGSIGERKEYEISKIVDEYNEKTVTNNEFPVLSSTKYGIFFQTDYFNNQAASSDTTGYKKVPYGYFTYRSMSDTGYFSFNVQNITKIGIVSPAYPVFSLKKGYDNNFFKNQMNSSDKIKKQILLFKEGGTRFALGFSKLKNIKVICPDFVEQQKIGELLELIDEQIRKNKEKLKRLKNMKQILFDKMFPEDNGYYPQIRFKEFNNKRNYNNLEELCDTITDGAHNSPKETKEGYFMPSVKDMTEYGFDFTECKKISKIDFEKLKNQGCMPKKGDVLISKDGSILSFCFSVEEQADYVILSSIAIVRPKKIINSLFLEQYFKRSSFKALTINQYSKGNALKRIVLKDFRVIRIQTTEYGEQKKLGDFFRKFDTLIKKQEEKVLKLKNLKKSLLEKMFI